MFAYDLRTESISELTRRPLYPISTGDLGTGAAGAEKMLRQIFRLAERWNAIVLLDEAELFLTERTLDDLDRNALVTVFLRTLEYFQGIMFLTSNLVHTFDPAFNSRIHLRVPYSEPDNSIRQAIWESFLPSSCDVRLASVLSNDLQVNGREIKNLVRTSLLIAKHKNEPVSEQIIRSIYTLNYAQANKQGSQVNAHQGKSLSASLVNHTNSSISQHQPWCNGSCNGQCCPSTANTNSMVVT